MSAAYQQSRSELLRLEILRVLDGATDGRANDEVVQLGLDIRGYKCTRDRVTAELEWLAERQLVELTDLDDFTIAQLLETGEDVVRGRTARRGIRAPRRPSR